LDKFKINSISNNNLSPQLGISLKPYVLLFDEIYTDLYRISEAENWMSNAKKIIFIGTSFSVNITSIALRTAISNNIEVEIVDPEPIKLNYEKAIYHTMTAEEYCDMRR
jgi:NAD-dependent deacetylase